MSTCLFDIDGTLLASGGAGKAALESAFTAVFGLPIREHIPYSGRTDRAIARDLLRLHDVEPSHENWERLLAGYLARARGLAERFAERPVPRESRPELARALAWPRAAGDAAVQALGQRLAEAA